MLLIQKEESDAKDRSEIDTLPSILVNVLGPEVTAVLDSGSRRNIIS